MDPRDQTLQSLQNDIASESSYSLGDSLSPGRSNSQEKVIKQVIKHALDPSYGTSQDTGAVYNGQRKPTHAHPTSSSNHEDIQPCDHEHDEKKQAPLFDSYAKWLEKYRDLEGADAYFKMCFEGNLCASLDLKNCRFAETCKKVHQSEHLSVEDMWNILSKDLPKRPKVRDCLHYERWGFCRYGPRCKWNHPDQGNVPERPEADNGLHYEKGDQRCKSNHPHVPKVTSSCDKKKTPAAYFKTGERENKVHKSTRDEGDKPSQIPVIRLSPKLQGNSCTFFLNFKGYPIRPYERACVFYLKAGHCSLGISCRFSHPEPCLQFHYTGVCSFGQNCLFTHQIPLLHTIPS